MSAKQLYFTILSFILTIVIIATGVYFVKLKQNSFAAVNVLTYLYNEVGKEMMASAKAVEIEQFNAWLFSEQNKKLIKITRVRNTYIVQGKVATIFIRLG